MKSLFSNIDFYNIPEAIQAPDIQGTNKKNLIVLVDKQDSTTENLDKLRDILKAIDHDLEKDVLLAVVDSDAIISLSNLTSTHSAHQVISFGILPERLSLNIKGSYNRWLNFETHGLLITYPLEHVKTKKENKIQLWNALKSRF